MTPEFSLWPSGGAQCWGHAEYVYRPLFITGSQSYFQFWQNLGAAGVSLPGLLLSRQHTVARFPFFFHLLMCSFLILAHLSKQGAVWPVSVSVQQFPSALFFTILNHSWLDQVGRMTEKKTFTITVCAFQRANIPHRIPREMKVV